MRRPLRLKNRRQLSQRLKEKQQLKYPMLLQKVQRPRKMQSLQASHLLGKKLLNMAFQVQAQKIVLH